MLISDDADVNFRRCWCYFQVMLLLVSGDALQNWRRNSATSRHQGQQKLFNDEDSDDDNDENRVFAFSP